MRGTNVLSSFPLFLLNKRSFTIVKRWNAKLPLEDTWRLCVLEDGTLFFTQGLGTMERNYIFEEGIRLKELPVRVRESALKLTGKDPKMQLGYFIDISSIKREMRDCDLPF